MPATGRYATCDAACAQHCGTVPSTERPECELGQVRCGCAPGMRRPPRAASPPTETITELPTTEAPTEPALPTTVPGCYGSSMAMTTWAATPYAEVHFGAAHALFLIDYGTTSSTIDPSAFDPPPTSSTPDGRALGCFPGLSFFRAWPCLALRTSDHHGVGAPFPQAGIFGTDVLAQHPYVLDYVSARLYSGEPGAFCSDAALTDAGLVALTTSDFGVHRARLNVPSILVRIGGTTAPAQLDTGFADRRVRHSMNINRAFFDLVASDALVRAPDRDLTLSTCAGVPEPVVAYRLASGTLDFLTDAGVARHWDDATIFLKDTPPTARRCGGIGTWSEPGAQLGASFLEDAGVVVLDPTSGRVWMRAE